MEYRKGSTIGEIRLHRTKCRQLLTKVISPAIKHELQEDAKNKGFAVLIDETTAKKNLCTCIRYFSEHNLKIETAYVGMVEVTEATCESLFQALKAALERIRLNLVNCFGFASDGWGQKFGLDKKERSFT